MTQDFPTERQAKEGLQAQKSSFCKPALARPGDAAILSNNQRIASLNYHDYTAIVPCDKNLGVGQRAKHQSRAAQFHPISLAQHLLLLVEQYSRPGVPLSVLGAVMAVRCARA